MSQVIDYFTHLFSTEGLPPRWLCGHWTPFQGWFYILSDLGIWSAYFTIPILLLTFIRQRRDVPFLSIFWLFAVFIFACGMTHFFDAVMFWWPAYRLSGLMYFYTAVISWVTVFALIPVIPKALALKSPSQFEVEIEERQRAEEALRENEKKYRSMIENVSDYAILSLSPEGNVTSWNRGAEKLKGYTASEIIGQHFSRFYPKDVAESGFPDYELNIAKQEGRFEDTGWRVRKDGSQFWANVIVTAIKDEQGNLLGFSKVTRDLTESKRYQDRLQAMNEELEVLVEQRTASLQKSLQREQMVVTIINSIRSELDLDTILFKTITLLGQYAAADRCVFWLYDPETQGYIVPSSEYHSSESPEIRYIKDTDHPAIPVLPGKNNHRDIINVSDLEQMDGLSPEGMQIAAERNVKSLLSVPVFFNDQFLGRLQLHAVFEKQEWDAEIVNVVQQVSDQVAIAIHNARLMNSLKESEARKSAIMDSAMDAVVMMNQSGNVVEWNSSAEQMFGYRRDEILGKPMELFIIPERLRTTHRQGLAHYLTTGEGPMMNQLLELPGLRADGSEFLAEVTITRVPVAGPALFTGILRDITERKQAEQALQESEKRFRYLANASPIMIWMLDADLQLTYLNSTLEEYFGVAGNGLSLGQNWQKEWVHPQDMPELAALMAHSIENRQMFSMECRVKRGDGAYRWVVTTGSPRLDNRGKVIGFVGTVMDIHDRKLITEALETRVQERTAQLQAANKELEAFSYSVSHDLRAPLRTIDGFSQAILEMYEDNLDSRGRDYLNRIRQGSQQMAKLIDDMLQLSRLTRGELNLEEGVNLSELAENIANTLQEEEPGRQVRIEIEPDLVARGDKRLLQAALQNLLANSWKYTSKHPTAHIEFGAIPSQNATIYYVKDDGAGFEMQYADKLFGAFQRLHGVDEFPGTGVGLATVARIIHRHGGEVWADAELEKGATFYFTLQAINRQEMENAKSFQQSHSAR